MTNLEALQSIIGINYPLDANVFSKALIDQGLTESDTYSGGNVKSIDLAYAGVLQTIIVSPDIKEGGYSVTQADRNALIKLRSSILAKYGIPDGSVGTITDKSYVW